MSDERERTPSVRRAFDDASHAIGGREEVERPSAPLALPPLRREPPRPATPWPVRRHLVVGLFVVAACGQAEGDPSDPSLGAGSAAEFHSAQVQVAMDAASALVQTRGFAPTGERWRGFLVQHASDVREVPMRSGTCYVGLAAASSAVRELSLRVFDSDGGEVMSEDVRGPAASLLFCPSQSGTYYLAVSVSVGSGLFEVRAFRGPTGLDIRVDDVFREVAPAEHDEKR